MTDPTHDETQPVSVPLDEALEAAKAFATSFRLNITEHPAVLEDAELEALSFEIDQKLIALQAAIQAKV